MSANVSWKPVKPTKTTDLGLWAPQNFMSMMESAFGSKTPTLNKDDLRVLRGMAAVWGEDKEQGNPFTSLIAAIQKHDVIELEIEY